AGPERRLVVGRDIEDQRGFAERVRRIFLYGFGGLALAGLAGGLLMSRVVVGRIDEINAAAHSIMAGDLDRRIETRGSGDEIDGLAQNLNAMLDRIEQLMGGLREVSDNIAHDLKTPLTRLRSRAEAALRGKGGDEGYRGGLERILEEADELIKTFNALLLIARLEAGAVEENMEAFDLAELVRDVGELYEPVAEEAGLSLAVEAGIGPRITANRQLIGQAVANLVDNAIKYGVGGARSALPAASIGVRVRVVEVDDGVEISVADRGPGIAHEDRERALKRFVRLERSRTKPGTGLGLSLVAAVARIHGGAIRLGDSEPGARGPGLKVVVWLPKRLYCEG
ncbi:MAG: HAMP domain-containing sensor histidine kinase, partial [Hyphomicrobium sp.]